MADGATIPVVLAASRSDRVIADSAATRDDIVRFLRADPARVDVVPLGVGSTRHGDATPERELRERHGLADRRVVLSVSAKRP